MRLLPTGTPLTLAPLRCLPCVPQIHSLSKINTITQRSGLSLLTDQRAHHYYKRSTHCRYKPLQSIFFYRDVVPDLVIRWKYDGMVELTNLIASWVASHCQISASYDLATIVRCHWRRRLTLGFDHMWLLANALAKTGLIEPPTKTLKHSKPLPFLHLQEAADRHIDPDHFHTVFSVKGKRILIIDDVITSGTTLRAAAAALKRDGAVEVSALTVATARELLLPTSRTRVQRIDDPSPKRVIC